jgi:hypothetical protein
VKSLSWINCVLGLWLIIASLVLPAGAESVTASASVGGIAIAILAYASAVGWPSPRVSWGVAGVALWMLIIDHGADTPARLNATVVGVIVLILGIANAVYQHTPHRAGA